jgi:hypothetical protein
MRIKRSLIGFVIFLVLLVPGTSLIFENGIFELPEIAAHLYARENCMCIFVSGFGSEHCRESTRQFIPVGSIEVNESKKSVSTRVFWAQSEFRFKNKQLGCGIIQ